LSADEEGSPSDGSTTLTSYEEAQLTPRLKKRARGEEDDDLDFDPKGKPRASCVESRVALEDDTISQRLPVSILHCSFLTTFGGLAQVDN
jgi:hypothetical protein